MDRYEILQEVAGLVGELSRAELRIRALEEELREAKTLRYANPANREAGNRMTRRELLASMGPLGYRIPKDRVLEYAIKIGEVDEPEKEPDSKGRRYTKRHVEQFSRYLDK
jgi:hypothetical protein